MGVPVLMAYVLPMMLGQTYDFGKDRPGIQIFDQATFENSAIIEHYSTDSQYRMVDSSKDVKDFLEVQGKLSLKIKAGLVSADGEGSYLRDRASRSNSVEILVKVHFETVTRTIPTSWSPITGWHLNDKGYLGTHYCRSMTYGGDLIASIRFLSTNRFDKEKIKGAVQAGINAKGVELDVKGQLEKLKDEVHDSSSMEINYYATVPIPGISYTIDGLLKLVNEFPKHVKNVNNGFGNPLRMEMYPLSSLESTLATYEENRALTDQLDDLEDQFDDLITTRKETAIWMNSLPPPIPTAVEEKISKFSEKLEDIFSTYSKAISELDLAVGGTVKSFEEAFKAYSDNGHMLPGKYIKALLNLQNEVYKEVPELKPRYGGANFITWGRSTCEGPETETVHSGAAVSSETNQNGGSSEFSCSPEKPDLEVSLKHLNSYGIGNQALSNRLLIGTLRYTGSIEMYSGMEGKAISCSVCRINRRTAVITLNALKTCPDDWTLQYAGFLMSAAENSLSKGLYVCVHEKMEPANASLANGQTPGIAEVHVKCGSVPCGPYDPNVPLPCVVCTR